MGYRNDAQSFLGTGFTFPVQVDEITGRFQTSSYEDDIKEAISIIINTRPGERVMRPGFGCRIHDYLFESMSYSVISGMEAAVREALTIWEPRIVDTEVAIDGGSADSGVVYIRISYVVRSTNNPFNLVYPFYLNEGLGA